MKLKTTYIYCDYRQMELDIAKYLGLKQTRFTRSIEELKVDTSNLTLKEARMLLVHSRFLALINLSKEHNSDRPKF